MNESNFPDCHKYDITSKLSPYLEPKMVLYVLDWLSSKDIYSADELSSTREELNKKLESVKLSDEEFSQMESDCLSKIQQFKIVLSLYKKDQLHRISSTFEKTTVPSLIQWANTSSLNVSTDFPRDVDELILKLAKAYFDREDYENCKSLLIYYVNSVSKYTVEGWNLEIIFSSGSSTKKKMKCYWGIISCNILSVLLPSSHEELQEMSSMVIVQQDPDNDKDATLIDQRTPRSGVYCILKFAELLNSEELNRDRKDLILKRCWLLHWSLFYIFKYHLALFHLSNKNTKSFEWPQLQEYFLDERNLAVVNLLTPHLLRYYAVYAILNRNRKDHFRTISNVIANTKHKYNDTFTSLLGALFVDFNFEAAQKHIVEIKEACYVDVLLNPLKDAIEESSRHIIFETYCRIHKSINLDIIAQNVNMTSLDAERWIVNIIRHSHVEAKIDSEKNCVEISTVPPNLYQQVIEKTQNLTLRSNMILQNLSQMTPNSDNSLQNLRNSDLGDRNLQRRLFVHNQQKKNQYKFNQGKEYQRAEQESLW
ncbi:eukaryotic translation initiation factor 3, subunit 6, putative [Theileria annulata]|uniref:Eukaryotic translation initiation factor 3 subunit E n=1 Tax=Theileria annulata TaxID=5874 RepID=Q4UE81_THEAN|nr:eukaryotic translation initiation factor 3, subunit 6, putative [Theileria annulata]CAI74608.1 eukaryotic translation initiation factor 3, subunit 6, putative [Theileria annulata]|eukprot:XP_952340.1 eukaryotic translation initiation factor 3, subunit 6, putative [Theileria annulata]